MLSFVSDIAQILGTTKQALRSIGKNNIGTLQVIDPQHQDDQANRPPSEQVKVIRR